VEIGKSTPLGSRESDLKHQSVTFGHKSAFFFGGFGHFLGLVARGPFRAGETNHEERGWER
jgi:hypothetical protein